MEGMSDEFAVFIFPPMAWFFLFMVLVWGDSFEWSLSIKSFELRQGGVTSHDARMLASRMAMGGWVSCRKSIYSCTVK